MPPTLPSQVRNALHVLTRIVDVFPAMKKVCDNLEKKVDKLREEERKDLQTLASLLGLADRFAYSATKGAVLTMTYSVATDYVKHGIRCNCVCPGRVHTPFVDGFLAKHYPGKEQEVFAKLSAYQPLGRMGKPHEIASLIRYLVSDDAAFVTGAAYPIDGGVQCKM